MPTMTSIFRHVQRFQLHRVTRRQLSKSPVTSMPDHMSITGDQTRQDILAPAIVTELKDISQTVKLLKLHVEEKKFAFKAGQWVDMLIPGVETVGGFSMCSAPHLLTSSGSFHLAIKFSQHPPAFWAHTKCKIGDSVMVRVGGDFYYDPQVSENPSDLVLLAGGVGINPLYSILQHFAFLSSHNSEQTKNRKAVLVYSAKTSDDLLFREEMHNICDKNADIKVKLRFSKESSSKMPASHIDQSLVRKVVSPFDKSRMDVFICGPSSFISDMESYCLSCDVHQDRIHYEKWW